jgi:hypothetical protein
MLETSLATPASSRLRRAKYWLPFRLRITHAPWALGGKKAFGATKNPSAASRLQEGFFGKDFGELGEI